MRWSKSGRRNDALLDGITAPTDEQSKAIGNLEIFNFNGIQTRRCKGTSARFFCQSLHCPVLDINEWCLGVQSFVNIQPGTVVTLDVKRPCASRWDLDETRHSHRKNSDLVQDLFVEATPNACQKMAVRDRCCGSKRRVRDTSAPYSLIGYA